MFGYVYMTTNLVTGMKYIGQKKYMIRHKYYLGSSPKLKADIKKYGVENFKKEILQEYDSFDALNAGEIYWISYYNAVEDDMFYNMMPGGGTYEASYITRKTQSESHMGEKAWQYGKKLSEEHRKHLSEHHRDVSGENNPNYGKQMPEEVKARISAKLKGKCYLTDEGRKKKAEATGIPVICTTTNTYYSSCSEAAKCLNFDSSTITKVCKGKVHQTHGYVFRYATRDEIKAYRERYEGKNE